MNGQQQQTISGACLWVTILSGINDSFAYNVDNKLLNDAESHQCPHSIKTESHKHCLCPIFKCITEFLPPQEMLIKEVFHTVRFHGCICYRVCCFNKFLASNFNYKDQLFKCSYNMCELEFTVFNVERLQQPGQKRLRLAIPTLQFFICLAWICIEEIQISSSDV